MNQIDAINSIFKHFEPKPSKMKAEQKHWCPNCTHELNGMELDEQECHNCNWSADEE
jgi:hypothetical protein